MNRYIIPVCIISNSDVHNEKIVANSISECKDKLMEKFSKYSSSNSYEEFLNELDQQDILIGDIIDIDEL